MNQNAHNGISQQCPKYQAAKTSEVLHFLSKAEWFHHQQEGQHNILCICISSLMVLRHS